MEAVLALDPTETSHAIAKDRPEAIRAAAGGWHYDVLPAEVRALRRETGWVWRVTQEVRIEDESGSCRGSAEVEIDGPSGRLLSLQHCFEPARGARIEATTLGARDLDAALRAVSGSTVRTILARRGDAGASASDTQVYKLAAALDGLCREAMRCVR